MMIRERWLPEVVAIAPQSGQEGVMKNTDKLLVAIVVGIVLVVVTAVVVTLALPKPSYLPDDTPEGVAQNYLLAIAKEDYARAYGYLSSTLSGYPKTLDAFTEELERYSSNPFYTDRGIDLQFKSVTGTGNYATVTMLATDFNSADVLFGGVERTTTFEIDVWRQQGQWKIVDAGFYFPYCWKNYRGCR
jgi:hypothetical protein